jgi:hypothetical protein
MKFRYLPAARRFFDAHPNQAFARISRLYECPVFEKVLA